MEDGDERSCHRDQVIERRMTDGVVNEQQVGGRAGVVEDVAHLGSQRRCDVLGVDVRFVAEYPQPIAQEEHLLRDGVTEGCARVELIDSANHQRSSLVATIA